MDEMVEWLSIYKGKRVLITGHTGFKGTWLSKILLNLGADVYGYSLLPHTTPNLYELSGIDSQINSTIGDVRDLVSLKIAFENAKPDIVFHMAAQPIVLESYKNPLYTYETNVMGTVNILECLRHHYEVKSFVNITTDKVYENKEWAWGYRENENLCGFDPYSNSKSCSELVTYSYKHSFFLNENSPAISTARSGNVIGGGDFAANRIIPDCVRAAMQGEEIQVRNSHSTRPYQHVLECLWGYLLLGAKQMREKTFEGCYNFGPDEDSMVTSGELVDLFCKLWGGNQNWENLSVNGPHEASFLKLDCSKAKTVLNWKPIWGIEEAVIKVVEWTKVFQNGGNIAKCMNAQIQEYFKFDEEVVENV